MNQDITFDSLNQILAAVKSSDALQSSAGQGSMPFNGNTGNRWPHHSKQHEGLHQFRSETGGQPVHSAQNTVSAAPETQYRFSHTEQHSSNPSYDDWGTPGIGRTEPGDTMAVQPTFRDTSKLGRQQEWDDHVEWDLPKQTASQGGHLQRHSQWTTQQPETHILSSHPQQWTHPSWQRSDSVEWDGGHPFRMGSQQSNGYQPADRASERSHWNMHQTARLQQRQL